MKQIRNAEVFRNAAVALLKKKATEALTMTEIYTHPDLSHVQIDMAHASQILADLSKRGDVRRVFISRPGDRSKYAYQTADSEGPVISAPKIVAEFVPDLKIAVLKKSGRLRLQWGGLSIEVGVVDE